MERLQQKFQQRQQESQFETFKQFLIGERQTGDYRVAAEHLKMTEDAVRQHVSRMRKEYRNLLREEIAETVSSPEEVEDEIRKLFQSLEL